MPNNVRSLVCLEGSDQTGAAECQLEPGCKDVWTLNHSMTFHMQNSFFGLYSRVLNGKMILLQLLQGPEIENQSERQWGNAKFIVCFHGPEPPNEPFRIFVRKANCIILFINGFTKSSGRQCHCPAALEKKTVKSTKIYWVYIHCMVHWKMVGVFF